MGLQRGSVVEIEGEHYVTLGCGFLTLEFANLNRPEQLRSVDRGEIAQTERR